MSKNREPGVYFSNDRAHLDGVFAKQRHQAGDPINGTCSCGSPVKPANTSCGGFKIPLSKSAAYFRQTELIYCSSHKICKFKWPVK